MKSAQCGFYESCYGLALCIDLAHADMDAGMQGAGFIFICKNRFVYTLEVLTFTDRTGTSWVR